MKLARLWPLLLVLLPATAGAQIELFNFGLSNPPPSMALQGTACYTSGRVRLTTNANDAGAVWYPTKAFLQEGFETTFQFQSGAGGEGIAFIVQNNALPGLGRNGNGLGYSGVPNSLAIEFDAKSNDEITDDPGRHVSVHTGRAFPNSSSHETTLGWAASELTADVPHTALIRYVPGRLEVFVDSLAAPLLGINVTLPNLFGFDKGQAWFGMVAANGSAKAAAEILSWSFELNTSPIAVGLLSPLEGGSFLAPGVIDLEATASGPAPITSVEFFEGNQLLFGTNVAPYRFRWNLVLPGAYTITAVATDSAGHHVTSQPARVLVYPSEPPVGINFMTGPTGQIVPLAPNDKAGVIPQQYWNNAPMIADGSGLLFNLRNAAGELTRINANQPYDFFARGEEPMVNPADGADYALMRVFGFGQGTTGSRIRLQGIPYQVYDLIIYTDGANGGADRVAQVGVQQQNVFVRDAAWTPFAGLYAAVAATSDSGVNTPAGNYVRLNGLTTSDITITNSARSTSDGIAVCAINAIQIVPSIFDQNAPATITRGPYLQMGTPTSMTVRWRSNKLLASRVSYGTSAALLDLSIEDSAETIDHTLTLGNLAPNTRYYYSVGAPQTNIVRGTNIFFWTAPTNDKPTRIWVIGDSGTANANAAAVRNAFRTNNANRYVDVWLMLGDNAYNSGTDAEYQAAVFNMYTNILPQTPLWPTIGNHETAQSHSQVPTTPYLSIFNLPQNGEAGGIPSGTERYYSFDYANIHFICLDSMTNDRSTNGPMATWLRADLGANTRQWSLVFFHHPPYTKGSHDSDDPTGQDFELVAMRENINPILEAYGVDLVMSGHSHCYERSFLLKGHYGPSTTLVPSMILNAGSGDPSDETETGGPYSKESEGTVYVVDGSSGQATFGTLDHPAHYKSMLNLGSVIIDVNGNQLSGRFVRETGEVQDNFTIVKQIAAGGVPALRVTSITTDQGIVALEWSSKPGTRYVVERTSNLASVRWDAVSDPLPAHGATLSWRSPAGPTSAAYYRVVAIE